MTRSHAGSHNGGPNGNRRSHVRVPTRVPIATVGQDQPVQIEAANISEGGAYCLSQAPLSVMTRIAVSIEIPDLDGDPEPVQIDAIVVRCEPHLLYPGQWNLALYFPELEEPTRERIASFVRARRAAEQNASGSSRSSDG
jgi:hypothetical protein